MKKLLLFVILLLLLHHVHAIHFFAGSYEEAVQKAKNENKNIFISFTTSWCGPCRLMHKMVYNQPEVIAYTDEHYISLLLDIEFSENTLLQQRVNPERAGGIPHVCILTPNGEIMREGGSMTVGQMMRFLKITPKDKPLRSLLAVDQLPALERPGHLFDQRSIYETVVEQAKREKKNMLLCFSSHFCGPCQQMERTTFQNPSIMKEVRSKFITGYFETGDPEDRALCFRYNNPQIVIPFMVLATPDGGIIRKQTGYMDSTVFMDFIRVGADSIIERINPETRTYETNGTPSLITRFMYNQKHHCWKIRISLAANTTTLYTAGSLAPLDFGYRAGYEAGFSIAREGFHWAVAPGLSFVSKGGRTKEFALRQNYLELPVKLTWIYQNKGNECWKGVGVSPYGSMRIGEKAKLDDEVLNKEVFDTKRFDYGLRCAANLRYVSFDFEAGYLLGLCNISDYAAGKMYNRGFFLKTSLCF